MSDPSEVAMRERLGTVVLVDDEHLIRDALTSALTAAGHTVIGTAETGAAALELVLDLRPEVVLMDLRLQGAVGVSVVEQIARLAPVSRILVLARAEENFVFEAILAGASGYILKSAPTDAIVAAVGATAAGESVISAQLTRKLLEEIRRRNMPVVLDVHAAALHIRATLTTRELEIFERIASGASNAHIGRDLHLSTHTVANHVASILAKLQLDNRIQAAAAAGRSGIG
jgi:DNA-binding NarL/FixJ family response regulator